MSGNTVCAGLKTRLQGYSGYGFNNIVVKNMSSNTISGWQAYLDFGAAKPTSVQWINGASATIKENFIVVEGSTALAPGATTQFSLGGQYTRSNVISISCF